MYENNVLAEGSGNLVPIYPFEGTFIATHPACISNSADADTQEAAQTFRDWLRSDEGQTVAVTYGMRPLTNVDTSALTSFAGVDLAQPTTVFSSPTVDTVYAVQELWQAARKPVHLALIMDTSGSMGGSKIRSMLEAAEQFVNQMGDNDYLTIIEFYTSVDIKSDRAKVGEVREELIGIVRNMEAGGDTSLYDAIGRGSEILAEYNSAETANALVVLTDGQDTSSQRYFFGEQLFNQASANSTTVFTIAYGRDADDSVLAELASEARGQFFQGDEASIGEIYDEMSAAFGGSVGIGR